jgi:transcriptional regulator with XRE-family HTH domain
MALLRRVIGMVLRRARQRQGRTLRQVADDAGLSVPYLSEVERGRKEVSSEILAGICRALGLTLADLLDQAREELLRSTPSRAPMLIGFRAPEQPPPGQPVPDRRPRTDLLVSHQITCGSADGRSAGRRIVPSGASVGRTLAGSIPG